MADRQEHPVAVLVGIERPAEMWWSLAVRFLLLSVLLVV
jgi:hypothetical protein